MAQQQFPSLTKYETTDFDLKSKTQELKNQKVQAHLPTPLTDTRMKYTENLIHHIPQGLLVWMLSNQRNLYLLYQLHRDIHLHQVRQMSLPLGYGGLAQICNCDRCDRQSITS